MITAFLLYLAIIALLCQVIMNKEEKENSLNYNEWQMVEFAKWCKINDLTPHPELIDTWIEQTTEDYQAI